MLSGLLVDSKGTRLTSSHATKGGRRYRYYVGTRTQQGQSKPWRLPAHEIETAVINELQRFLGDRQRVANAIGVQSLKAHELKEALWTAKEIAKQIDQTTARREIVTNLIKQVRVTETEITVDVRLAALVPDGARLPKNKNHWLSIPVELGRRTSRHHADSSSSLTTCYSGRTCARLFSPRLLLAPNRTFGLASNKSTLGRLC